MTNRTFQRSTLTLVPSSSIFARSFEVNSERFLDFSSKLAQGLHDLEARHDSETRVLEVKISGDVETKDCSPVMESEFDFEVDARWI